MYGPVIQGKLVRLRPPKAEDAPLMITWFEDMEVTRFLLLRHPPSIDMEKDWLDKTARNPDEVVWVVEHKGQAVGTTALHLIDWKNGSAITGTVIGDKSVWGKGLGRELMQLRAKYAFTQLPLRKLKSAYLDGNVASWRAQSAAGYREVGRHREDMFVDGRWVDEIITEVLREDWEKAQAKPRRGR
ncbi:MAG TPA: GNAT family protein [Candidatus Dormibacteraeota bacterium]|nr:GNAT family protein [Candidatus Dormibacteraeota bacterium]